LNEVRILVSHRSAQGDLLLVRVIPKDGQNLIVLGDLMDGRNGRSFLHPGQLSFCLSKVCPKMVCQFLGYVIPKDGQS
jgi:hypothetical protein